MTRAASITFMAFPDFSAALPPFSSAAWLRKRYMEKGKVILHWVKNCTHEGFHIFFSLYLLFPKATPEEHTEEFKELHNTFHDIEAGEGRTMGMQAVMQMAALAVTFGVANIAGAVTGKLKYVKSTWEKK